MFNIFLDHDIDFHVPRCESSATASLWSEKRENAFFSMLKLNNPINPNKLGDSFIPRSFSSIMYFVGPFCVKRAAWFPKRSAVLFMLCLCIYVTRATPVPSSSSGATRLAANFNTLLTRFADPSTASPTAFTGSDAILVRPPGAAKREKRLAVQPPPPFAQPLSSD